MRAWRQRAWWAALALLAAGSSAGGAERPEVLWYVANFPPSSIQEGPQRGQGYLDRLLADEIWPGLPQFRHRIVPATPARGFSDALHAPNVCMPATLLTPERAGRYAYSEPIFRFLPSGLVVRGADLPALVAAREAGGEVDLGRVFDTLGWSIGVVGERRHGPAVDAMLARHAQAVVPIHTLGANTSLLLMVSMQRSIQATLAYSFDIGLLEARHPERRGQLVWLPLAGQPSHLMSRIACSPSPLGQQVIAALEPRLPRFRDRAQGLYESWLDAASRETLARQRRELRRGESFWSEPVP